MAARAFAATLLLAGCRPTPAVVSLSGAAQGTTYTVRWSASSASREELAPRLHAELDRIDRLMSNYRPDSVIEGFNRAAADAPVPVGAEITGLLRVAREVRAASDGCYDPTVLPFTELWGFRSGQFRVPAEGALDSARAAVGLEKVEPVGEMALRKAAPGVRVDLSSIAQGFTVGRLAALLEAAGARAYVVELGGELAVRGTRPDGNPWRVGIERPLPGERRLQRVVEVLDAGPCSIMTSGTYRHYYDAGGRRYSHILDARTGRPVGHDLVSVTVFGTDPSVADAWSTALLCLGPRDGPAAADRAGVAALFIAERAGELIETRSRKLTASPAFRIE